MPFDVTRQGSLFVISAPSGGGKSEALKRLLASDEAIGYSVSYTSRAPRGDEVEGKQYHFVSRERFEEMIGEGAFYECAEVHGNLYGTSTELIEAALETGRDMALDIDVQGGLNIKKLTEAAVLIFLMPPSMDELERRLRGRNTDHDDAIELRMENARREVKHWHDYDYVIVNKDIDRTVKRIQAVVEAERLRGSRTLVRRNEERV